MVDSLDAQGNCVRDPYTGDCISIPVRIDTLYDLASLDRTVFPGPAGG